MTAVYDQRLLCKCWPRKNIQPPGFESDKYGPTFVKWRLYIEHVKYHFFYELIIRWIHRYPSLRHNLFLIVLPNIDDMHDVQRSTYHDTSRQGYWLCTGLLNIKFTRMSYNTPETRNSFFNYMTGDRFLNTDQIRKKSIMQNNSLIRNTRTFCSYTHLHKPESIRAHNIM